MPNQNTKQQVAKVGKILSDTRMVLAIVGIVLAGLLWLMRKEVEPVAQAIESHVAMENIHIPVSQLCTKADHEKDRAELKENMQLEIKAAVEPLAVEQRATNRVLQRMERKLDDLNGP